MVSAGAGLAEMHARFCDFAIFDHVPSLRAAPFQRLHALPRTIATQLSL